MVHYSIVREFGSDDVLRAVQRIGPRMRGGERVGV